MKLSDGVYAMPIEKIKKRDGRVVDFDRARIARVIEKACESVNFAVPQEMILRVTDAVVRSVEERFAGVLPGVEDVQDIVERELAIFGLFDVAKAYIIYRKDRERARLSRAKQEGRGAAGSGVGGVSVSPLRAAIEKVKKRDGRLADFDRTKIERVIEKACAAIGVGVAGDVIGAITDAVVFELGARFAGRTPGVEDVQDVVERKIAEHGLFDVAKAYILYRKEHERIREEKRRELLRKIEQREVRVKKRDGSFARFDEREIVRMVAAISAGCEALVDTAEIVGEVKRAVYDGVPTSEINRAIVYAFRARIERDPNYSYLAAKMLLGDLYKDVLGVYAFEDEFVFEYRGRLARQVAAGVACGRLDPRLSDFDMERLGSVLDPARDGLFEYLGAQTLYDRYFLKDYDQRILECPQHFWMRVAMGLALAEDPAAREIKAIEFYHAMSELRYVPSTPTLFHAGTLHPQMSSCYITTVEDDLTHIFKSIGDNAQLAKWSGGVGNDWTNIRGTGSMIKSTNVGSQGVIPFLKVVDAATAAINRSGKRRGATCVYLETWHYDIESFLELRKNTGDDRRRTHDTNTANWIPDLFMKRVMNDDEWTLFSSDETPDLHHLYGKAFERRYEEYEQLADEGRVKLWKRLKARDLWRKMITMLYETGHPWMTFKDPCNIRSPQDHVGVVHSSNLCTEITLNTSADETAVCNLGSINLSRHVAFGALNRPLLESSIATAMRMLDNVIDLNYYPTPEAERSNFRHRPVGLGIMGFHDALYKLGLAFDSEEAVTFSDECMELIAYHAILASSRLAKERGAYETYRGSKWDRGLFPLDTCRLLEEERGVTTGIDFVSRMDWSGVRAHVREHGMRNSNCMAIAPTATISNISGCIPTVEPIYKNVYTKSNFSGEFIVVNEYLVEDLKRLGLWDQAMIEKLKYFDGSVGRINEIPLSVRERYKEVFEIDTRWIVRHAAYRAKWLDQSQSVNMFTSSKSGKFLSDVYFEAWKTGLKTTYYLRTLGASGIEKSTIDINKKHEASPVAVIELDAPAAEVPVAASMFQLGQAAEVVGETCEACQ